MPISAIILLIIFGVILLITELLVIPGITVAGIAGVLLIAGGVFCGYYYHDIPEGHYILIVTAIMLLATLGIALKSKTWKRFGLEATIDGRVGEVEESIKKGDQGRTVSRLAPAGKAMFHEILMEVRTDGDYIDSNKDIIIIRIAGNKIYVELKT